MTSRPPPEALNPQKGNIMSIIRHEIRRISDENRGQPIISQAVVHGDVAYFAGITPTRLSAISKRRLLKCCDASMSFSTSREPTNHSY
jgi:hypothetical protein